MKKFIIVFLFLSFVSASCGDNQIDINSASVEDLDKIVGIGPSTAEKIIDSRPFKKFEDLDRVSGIGEKKLEDIRNQGLACMETEDTREDAFTEEKVSTISYFEPNMTSGSENIESIINLNPEESLSEKPSEKVIYESKNGLIKRYILYAFCFFLIFLIFVILIKE